MIRVELAPEVLDDFERILAHLIEHRVPDPATRIADIVAALGILREHPNIGRPMPSGDRELVTGRGSRGYLARYRFAAAVEVAFVLAIKSQGEGTYRR